MKNKIFIIYSILFILSFEFCYSLDFQFKKQYKLLNVIDDHDLSKSKIINGKFSYGYVGKMENDSCYFYINTSDGTNTEQLELKLPVSDSYNYFKDFMFYGDKLFLAISKKIYILTKVASGDYLLEKIIFSSKLISTLSINNNTLYAIGYSIAREVGNPDIVLTKVDFHTFKTDSVALKSPHGIEFMISQPRKLFDISDKFIALSNAKEYSIDIFDIRSNKKLYTISKNYSNWENSMPNVPASIFRTNPHEFFQAIYPKLYKSSLIQKVYLVDTNKLLVIWNNIDSDSTYMQNYDLYSIDDEKSSDISSASIKVNAKLDEAFNPITYTHNDVQYANGKLYTITNFPFDYKDFIGKTVREMRKAMEEYYLDNETILSAFVWDFK